jgi:hypothetical protein
MHVFDMIRRNLSALHRSLLLTVLARCIIAPSFFDDTGAKQFTFMTEHLRMKLARYLYGEGSEFMLKDES